MEPEALVLFRRVLGIQEWEKCYGAWGASWGHRLMWAPLQGLAFPLYLGLKGDTLSCGFHRMAAHGAVQLGQTAGAAGIPRQGEHGWAEVGGQSRASIGRGPGCGSRDGETSKDRWWGRLGELRGGRGQRPGCACVPFLASFPPSVPQALIFIIFVCFTASISAYMAAALLEFFITLAFLFLYATQYYQRFDRLNWPCLVRDPASPTPFWSLSSLHVEFSFPLPASLLFLV